jgi:hypothetical protein
MVTPLLVAQDAGQSFRNEVVEPSIDGVRVAVTEQSLGGDRVGGQAIGNLQQGGAAFADIRAWVMIAVVRQFVPLGLR